MSNKIQDELNRFHRIMKNTGSYYTINEANGYEYSFGEDLAAIGAIISNIIGELNTAEKEYLPKLQSSYKTWNDGDIAYSKDERSYDEKDADEKYAYLTQAEESYEELKNEYKTVINKIIEKYSRSAYHSIDKIKKQDSTNQFIPLLLSLIKTNGFNVEEFVDETFEKL